MRSPGLIENSFFNDAPCRASDLEKGLDCIVAFDAQKESDAGKHEFTCDRGLRARSPRAQGYRVKRTSACGGCLGDYRR